MAIAVSTTLVLGAAVAIGWLLWLQAAPPSSTWVSTDGPLMPPEEDPWLLLDGRGEVTMRTAPGRILFPLELTAELKELFHGFSQADHAGLEHVSVTIRAYGAAHLLLDEPRQLTRLRPLLADDTPVRVSPRLGDPAREVALNRLIVELLCAVGSGEEPSVAKDQARRLLLRLRRDQSLLAVRGDVRACLGSEADGVGGARAALGDLAAGVVSSVRQSWRDGFGR